MSRTVSNYLRHIVNTAVLATLASATEDRARVDIETAAGTVLASLPLTAVAGTLAADGVLTMAPGPRVESAPAAGMAAVAKLYAPAGTLLLTLPVVTEAAPDTVVVSPVTITFGQPVELVSAVVS
jgi:hypothetical protein